MAVIALVSCGKRKRSTAAAAKDLYTSPLFRLSRQWAEVCADRWFVVSAKYGLVDPDQLLDPYDLSLDSLSASQITAWYNQVTSALLDDLEEGDVVILLMTELYGRGLKIRLRSKGLLVADPLVRMSPQTRRERLRKQISLGKSSAHLECFYGALEVLANICKPRYLGEEGNRWPQRGVYFFFEPGELRSNQCDLRVTRVGTHAVSAGARTTLWDRLKTHRGVAAGGGNHRSSVFRLHIGTALINRENMLDLYPAWGRGQRASAAIRKSESPLEYKVSVLMSRMLVLAINVCDASSAHSDRSYIERNAIALLSTAGQAIDPPSSNWLGHYARDNSVRTSGLWNVRHVGKPYDERFLTVMYECVLITVGAKPCRTDSLAPASWWTKQGILR